MSTRSLLMYTRCHTTHSIS